jgi:hypothetical protein
MIILPRRHHFDNRDISTTFDAQIRINTQLGMTEMADLTEIEPAEQPESRGLMAAIFHDGLSIVQTTPRLDASKQTLRTRHVMVASKSTR